MKYKGCAKIIVFMLVILIIGFSASVCSTPEVGVVNVYMPTLNDSALNDSEDSKMGMDLGLDSGKNFDGFRKEENGEFEGYRLFGLVSIGNEVSIVGKGVSLIKTPLQWGFNIQEHNWLEAIYLCLYEGDCKALNLLEQINETTNNLWNEFKPTDSSVVIQEDVISNTLNSSQNITINYTIKAPPKAGYSTGDYAPMRIAFWFLDTTNNKSCLDQDKQTDANRAEKSYCIPLIAETLAIVNEEVNFLVELRPNLPAGNYEIVRDIEIDPNQVWIKYGQEIIDKIKVSESNNNPNIFVIKQEIPQLGENFEDLAPEPEVKSSGLTYVTSPATSDINIAENTIENVQRLLSGSQIVSIIAMVCALLIITIICFTIYKVKNAK